MTRCARCGREDPKASARVWLKDKVAIYCHGDAPSVPTCYTLSNWDNFPELRGEA